MQPQPGQEAPWERGPRLLTSLTGALTFLAIYVVAAFVAYRSLMAFPTPYAFWTLVVLIPLAATVGAWVGAIEGPGTRLRAAASAFRVTVALPFALIAWVPGIAQPQQHVLPGGTDVVIAAAPDENLDLYLIPGGDPDRSIELTDTPVAAERFPELAPDGRSLVYVVDAPDGTSDLHLMKLDDRGRPAGRSCCWMGPATSRRPAGPRTERSCSSVRIRSTREPSTATSWRRGSSGRSCRTR